MSSLVPEGWQSVKFKDVFNDYKYGPRFSSKDYDDSGNVKTIRGTDVSSIGEIKYQQVPTATLDRKLVDNNKLCNGDLVMITTADCGMTAVFYEQKIPYIASAYAIRLTPSKYISSEYIKFFMQTFNAKKQVESLVRKGTVANLPGSDVMSLALNLPPLPEQKKIAAILTSVDDVIEKTQAQIDKLKDLKTGMMQELLTRGVGVDGKPHTEFKDSPVGRIPKGWEVRGIYDVCNEIFLGLTAKVDYTESDGAYLIRATDISNGVLSFSKARQITHSQHQSLTKKRQAKRGDVLVSKSGSLGVCALVDTDVEFSIYESIIVLQPKGRVIDSKYLLWLMRATETQTRLLGGVVGSTVGHLNLGDFRKLKVPIPSFEEQIKLGRVFDSLNQKFTSVENRLLQYKSLKKALMQDLLTGKKRVKVDS
ncbi:restriction endonuclease subunit S [Vibrio gallaecicus]|uniref:restriction endonuclease subunit S n=1 Tax=Vibrio gallaecicus TaxID=552386 RepID=UPI0010C9751B|nr:restriction endonuclease subunit S [Vibrio gallaecicus]MDN3614245.1 restriction endonuclease subunit S [Vibrio gallaecicus]